jgi:hypothetical protein
VQKSGVFLKPQNANDFCTFNVVNIAFWLLGGVGGIMGGSSKKQATTIVVGATT